MRGYTLLEMIVAIGIFSIVMLAATGAYLTLIDLDSQARAVNDIVSNLSFAVDSMARSVRTGTNYACTPGPNNTSGTCHQLDFTDENGRSITYRLSNGQIYQDTVTGGVTTHYTITDPSITVSTLTFYVRGVGTSDSLQPQTTFLISGTIAAGQGKTIDFSIEGAGTERFLELP
jgi:prepilin-type N-terminal cleavage/methylation domain-containing protein